MSASPMARQACSHAQLIPTRKIFLTDPSQLPDVYSSTPGGTLYSTTPGGTRIIYDKTFLLNLKNSPLSQTPPKNVPTGLLRGHPNTPIIKVASPVSKSPPKQDEDDHQFDMDL
uniref:Putative eukaryotic translation initiation factor 4e binding protein 4ebp n=1 Tax=Tabanus bromius TaxID=304241 RepID=A0A0K8TQE8_TABBR